MANIKPIETTVWDLRIISFVRRELEKSFNSMTIAFDQAAKTPSEEAQIELNSKSNSFCDLYEKRLSEYNACAIEDEPNAEEVAGQLMQDMVRYKITLESHFKTQSAEDVDEIVDDPAEDVGVLGRLSLLHESRTSGKGEGEDEGRGKPEVTKGTAPARETPPASMLNSLRKKVSLTMTAGKKALENVVGNQTPEKRQPSSHPPPPPPPPATPAAAAAPTTEDSTRPRSLPPGFQRFEDERQEAEKAEEKDKGAEKPQSVITSVTPRADPERKNDPKKTESTASSTKSSKKGSQRSKTSTVMSQQVEKDRQRKREAEEERIKSSDAQADADIAYHQSIVQDLQRQKDLDKTLHKKELENIDRNAADLQALITAAEDDQSTASGAADEGEKSRYAGAGLEMTAAGAAFGGESPDALTSAWVNGVMSRPTSTAKKEVRTKTPSIPERSLPDPQRKSKKKLNVEDPKKEKEVKKEDKKPPTMPVRKLGDVKPKKAKTEKPEKTKGEIKTKDKKPGVKVDASAPAQPQRSRSPSHLSVVSRSSSTPSKAPSTASSSTSSCASSASNTLMTSILRLQQQQLEAALKQTAIQQLKEARPAKKFSGSTTKRMDFEKHMKIFNEAMEIPGVSKRQMLNEMQHWFEGSAFKLIEAETLRKSESAVDEAVTKLTKKFGMRQETALEMLDEVLQGKTVDEKDHNGMLDFYARLVSVHSFAVETKKADDFENKLVVKTIVEKKLPFLKDKWAKKVVRYRKKNNSDLKFADFLEFIDEEQTISEMLSGYHRSNNQNKPAASAKISATTANAAAKKDTMPTPVPKTAPGLCPRCDGKHGLASCPTYCEMNASDRRKFNKNLGICFRCLEGGHLAKACPSTITCDKCNGFHHPLAHPEPNPAGKQPDDNKNAGEKGSGSA